MSGIGHIGELRVMEFLRKKKGMDIYLPLKDKGIDFIAVKRNKFFQIQVKTSMFQKNSYFWFDLYRNRMIFSDNTLYIFVCATLGRRRFMDKSENYLVVPSMHLEKWISEGGIVSKKGDDNCLNIFIYPDLERNQWTYRNKGKQIEWAGYWNNFSLFE
jgi:hypothetical protein